MRVTFVRGPRRVVLGSDSSLLGRLWVIRVDVDVSLLPDVSDGEVVEDGALISVVTGGLVLVIVAVVVGVDADRVVVAENDGSTKLRGAYSGSLN